MKKICVLVIVLSLTSTSSGAVGALAVDQSSALRPSGTIYYVDQDHPLASDANPGTEGAPWATIQHAADVLEAGDTVYVKEGVYLERVIPQNSGTVTETITYAAYPGDEVILDGSVPITNWNHYTGSIYYAEFDWGGSGCDYSLCYPWMIYEDDVAMIRAQHPNQPDAYDPWKPEYYLVQEDGGMDWFVDDEIPGGFSYVGARLNYFAYASVYDTNATVVAYDPAQHIITTTGGVDFSLTVPSSTRVLGYSFWDKLKFLDTPGEFYMDTSITPHRIYVWAYDDQAPDNMRAARLTNAFDIDENSVGYVTVEGFVIRGYNFNNWTSRGVFALGDYNDPEQGIAIRDNKVYNNVGAAVYVRSSDNVTIETNHFYHNGVVSRYGYGVLATECSHVEIVNNTIHDNTWDGIYFQDVQDSLIEGNTIYNHRSLRTHADGLKIETFTEEFACTNIDVIGNVIYDATQTLYTQGIRNSNFYNNVIYNSDTYALRFSGGNDADERSDYINVIGNTLIDGDLHKGLTLSADYCHNFTVRNNILDGWVNLFPDLDPTVTYDHNLYVGLAWTQMESRGWYLGDGEIVEEDFDQVFRDWENDDFRLKASSPAIDAGVDVSSFGIVADAVGTSRPQGAGWDMGAYEFVPELTLYGTPSNRTIHLNWEVNTTLPATSTWQIDYQSGTGTLYVPITGIVSPTRAYTLTDLTNYVWYTVTLNAVLGSTPFLTDTVRVMPTDRFVYLPLVFKHTQR